MTVYELIQELVKYGEDDEINIRVNKADIDTTCPECEADITIGGETFDTEYLSITDRNHTVTIEVNE